MSFCTAVLEEICGRVLREEKGVRVKKIDVWWAVRDEGACSLLPSAPSSRPTDSLSRSRSQRQRRGSTTRSTARPSTCPRASSRSTCSSPARSRRTSRRRNSTRRTSCRRPAAPPPGASSSLLPSLSSDGHLADALSPTTRSCATSHVPWCKTYARPSFPDLLSARFAAAPDGSTLGIASCGPASLTTDVRRAVAARQKVLAFAQAGAERGAAEVELHTEEFEW